MIDKTIINGIRKPNNWNTYTNPVDNLLHAILIQAVADCNGYMNDNKWYDDGSEATEFLEEYGRQILDKLITADRKKVTYSVNKDRRYRVTHRKGTMKYKEVK